MALTIFWTKRAQNKFDKIILYLEESFGETVTHDFVIRVYELMEILKELPEIGSIQHEQKRIRGFVIIKQVKLFYKITSEKIIILNLFETRQSQKKKGH